MGWKLVNSQEILESRGGGGFETAFDVTVHIFGPQWAELHRDDRPKKVATERMLWPDGRLCAAVGHEYAEDDEPLLMTEAEWMAAQQ